MAMARLDITKGLAGSAPLGVLSHLSASDIAALPYGAARKEEERNIDEKLQRDFIGIADACSTHSISRAKLKKIREAGLVAYSHGNRLYFKRDELEEAVKAHKGADNAETNMA